MKKANLLAAAFILAAAGAAGQTTTVDKSTLKAIRIDQTIPPIFTFYEPNRPVRERATGDRCEGDWIGAIFYVNRTNGLVISERDDAVDGGIFVEMGVGWDNIGNRAIKGVEYAYTFPLAHCETADDRSRIHSTRGPASCFIKDSDFDANNRTKIFIWGNRNSLGIDTGTYNVYATAHDSTRPTSTRYWEYAVTSFSTKHSVTVDNVCTGAADVELPVGGGASFTFDVLGEEYTIYTNPERTQGRVAYRTFSSRDYEITMTPAQPKEPFQTFLWAYNCSVTPCQVGIRGVFVGYDGPTVIRLPLDVWGESRRFSVGVRHENTWGLGDSERTTVGFTLSVARIVPPVPPSGSGSSFAPEVAFGAPTRHPVPLVREDHTNAPAPMLDMLTPW